MAILRFSFGTMGSGKSTLALQIHHNLTVRHLQGLLLTKLDRDGTQVTSRLGVSAPAVEVSPTVDIYQLVRARTPLDFLVCDEVQFYSAAQCDQLARVVDDLGIDVYAFGLITDFRGLLFEGTRRMLEVADERVEMQVEARCWCGARATKTRESSMESWCTKVKPSWSAIPARHHNLCSVTLCATNCSAVAIMWVAKWMFGPREARKPRTIPSVHDFEAMFLSAKHTAFV